MTMTFSEAAKLSAISRKEMEARIDEYVEQFRPKIVREYYENGHKITVLESAHASNCECQKWVKPTGKSGAYEV